MPDMVKQIEEIAQRLKSNYPECEITQSNGTMVVQMALGRMEVTGLHVSTFALGDSFGELDFDDADQLYEGIEAYLLVLRDEEMRCNPTYTAAMKQSGRNCRWLLYASVIGTILLFLGYLCFDFPKVLFLIALLLSVVAPLLFPLVQRSTFRKLWVCPHCGTALPLKKERKTSHLKSCSCCPSCGTSLLDPALVEQLRQDLDSDEQDDNEAEVQATASDLPKPGGKLPSLLFGVLLLPFALFLLYGMFLFLEESSSILTAGNIVTLLGVAGAGFTLLFCHAPKQDTYGKAPKIAVYEQKLLPAFGIFLGLVGMGFTFCSFALTDDDALALGLFAPIGLGLLWLGVWMLLARKNRSLLVYHSHLVYTSSFGKVREIQLSQIAAVQATANGGMKFLDENRRKLFAVEANMVGAYQLIDWIDVKNLPLTATKSLDKQAEQAEKAENIVSWHKADHTPMHDHLPAIRIGLVVVVLLFAAGCFLPFLLYLTTAFKMTHIIYLTALAPVPMILYYIIFAPVLLLTDRPKGATAEWRSMHIKFPTMIVLILALMDAALVYYFWNNHFLYVVDDLRLLIVTAIVATGLIALFRWRTPKRIRDGESLFVMGLGLILLSFVMLYGGNLAISKPAQHYPLVVVDRTEPTEDDEDSDWTLTILLDDGDTATLQVSEQVYTLEESGTEFVVCEKESFLGIRMVRLHLPEGATLPDTDTSS